MQHLRIGPGTAQFCQLYRLIANMEAVNRRLSNMSSHIHAARDIPVPEEQSSIVASPCRGSGGERGSGDLEYSVILPEQLTNDGEWRVRR